MWKTNIINKNTNVTYYSVDAVSAGTATLTVAPWEYSVNKPTGNKSASSHSSREDMISEYIYKYGTDHRQLAKIAGMSDGSLRKVLSNPFLVPSPLRRSTESLDSTDGTDSVDDIDTKKRARKILQEKIELDKERHLIGLRDSILFERDRIKPGATRSEIHDIRTRADIIMEGARITVIGSNAINNEIKSIYLEICKLQNNPASVSVATKVSDTLVVDAASGNTASGNTASGNTASGNTASEPASPSATGEETSEPTSPSSTAEKASLPVSSPTKPKRRDADYDELHASAMAAKAIENAAMIAESERIQRQRESAASKAAAAAKAAKDKERARKAKENAANEAAIAAALAAKK